jgi:hypothetical protein
MFGSNMHVQHSFLRDRPDHCEYTHDAGFGRVRTCFIYNFTDMHIIITRLVTKRIYRDNPHLTIPVCLYSDCLTSLCLTFYVDTYLQYIFLIEISLFSVVQ